MRKFLYVFTAAAVICVILFEMFLGDRSVYVFASNGKKPIYCVDTAQNKIAISFDAAWGADNTKKILDILESHNVSATFFLVGFWVDKYPEVVKEIYDRGFEIGNHSENHPEMTKLSMVQMKDELLSVNNKIKAITGEAPRFFRPPFGAYNDTVIDAVNSLGMHTVQWSIDSLDWKEYGRQELINRVLKKLKNGDIILFHNNAKYTPDALSEILDKIQEKGYIVCSVGELVYTEEYYVDSQGIQHKNHT